MSLERATEHVEMVVEQLGRQSRALEQLVCVLTKLLRQLIVLAAVVSMLVAVVTSIGDPTALPEQLIQAISL